MPKVKKPLFYIALFISAIFLLINTKLIFAADLNTSLGFAPDSLYLDLNPGETYNGEVILWSHDLNSITLYSAITTFKQVDKFPGTAAPLFENKDTIYPFSGTSWVTEVPSQVVLKEGGENTIHIPFKIKVPLNTKDGLYRVKITFTTNSDFESHSNVQTKNNLLIGPAILITVGDNLKESLQFQNMTIRNNNTAFFTDKDLYNSLPVKFTTSLVNDGQTYVTPIGDIVIYNWLNQEIDRIKFNKDKLSLIDNEIGLYNTSWEANQQFLDLIVNNKISFGKLHAKLILTYSNENQSFNTLSSQTTFWVIPWKILIILILTIISFITLKIKKFINSKQSTPQK